jgi:hypothetical protein
MGMFSAGMQAQTVTQLKKGQGETNRRLEELLAEQRQTNKMLADLVDALRMQARVLAARQPTETR